jgi:hypothetical protein
MEAKRKIPKAKLQAPEKLKVQNTKSSSHDLVLGA